LATPSKPIPKDARRGTHEPTIPPKRVPKRRPPFVPW
jgi:hypothetical protein